MTSVRSILAAVLCIATFPPIAHSSVDCVCPQPSVISQRQNLPDVLNQMHLEGEGVEVGTFRGHFATFLLRKWGGKKLHCVDLWESYNGFDSIINVRDNMDLLFEEAKRALEHFPSRYQIHRGKSAERAADFQDSSLDFAYIDANHQYEYVKEDLAAYWIKVKPGGLMAGNDMYTREPINGVRRAILEFAQEHGLTVFFTDITGMQKEHSKGHKCIFARDDFNQSARSFRCQADWYVAKPPLCIPSPVSPGNKPVILPTLDSPAQVHRYLEAEKYGPGFTVGNRDAVASSAVPASAQFVEVDYAHNISRDSLGFVHVNGHQHFAAVTKLLETFYPLLRTGGVLLGDGVFFNEPEYKTRQAVLNFAFREGLSVLLTRPAKACLDALTRKRFAKRNSAALAFQHSCDASFYMVKKPSPLDQHHCTNPR